MACVWIETEYKTSDGGLTSSASWQSLDFDGMMCLYVTKVFSFQSLYSCHVKCSENAFKVVY